MAACCLVAGGWALAGLVKSPEQRAAEAGAPDASLVTAEVERRALVERVVTRGDVSSLGAVSVPGSAGVLTKLPVRRGDEVAAGSPVAEVAGRPVLVMVGTSPAFRDMRPGQSGDDIAQLQAGLVSIGFDPGERDGVFGAGTKAAVSAWYASLGYEAVPTASDVVAQLEVAGKRVRDARAAVELAQLALSRASAPLSRSARLELDGRVADAQAALDAAVATAASDSAAAEAERTAAAVALVAVEATGDHSSPAHADARARLAKADAALTAARATGEASVAAAQRGLEVAGAARDDALAGPDTSGERRAVTSAVEEVAAADMALAALEASSGPTVPLGEVVFVPVAPVVVDALTGRVGEAPGNGWMQLSSGHLLVAVRLSAAARALLPLGAAATLDDDVSGLHADGRLSSVDEELSSTEAGGSGYGAVVTPVAPLAQSLAGRNVRVTLEGQRSGGDALVVPLSAVFTRADGSTSVVKLTPTGTEDVAVEPGLSAGGFVVVTAVAGVVLSEGDRVVVSDVAGGAQGSR